MAKDYLWDYDSTAANNTDVGGVNIAEGCNFGNMNNMGREQMSHIADWLAEASLASASASNMATTAATCVNITGTTTITSFGTVKAGVFKFVRFAAALQLTHNATSFILPGGANITTAAGDTAVFKSEGSGNWRCHSYQRAANGAFTILDEDDMASDSATSPPSQQSAKAYIDGKSFTDAAAWLIIEPEDGDYRLIVKAPFAGTITETTTRSTSGTCTATFKINTTALGGTANSVSSSEQSQAHSSDNAFVAGDDIVLTVSSNSNCANLSATVKYTRALS